MKPLRVAIKQSNPRGEDHNAGTSIGIGHIACSTCAALSGTLMARIRGDGTWAMSLGVSNTPSTPARKSQRYCSLCSRHIPNQPWQRRGGAQGHDHASVEQQRHYKALLA